MPSRKDAFGDGELMREIAGGSAEALGMLHRRFAPFSEGSITTTAEPRDVPGRHEPHSQTRGWEL